MVYSALYRECYPSMDYFTRSDLGAQTSVHKKLKVMPDLAVVEGPMVDKKIEEEYKEKEPTT